MEVNKIWNEDCLQTMSSKLVGGGIDIVLTSPPYNTGRDLKSQRARDDHEGRYDEYSESKTNEEYDGFTVNLFNGFDKVLSPNGVVLYNISYGTENPTQMWTCISDVCKRTNFTIADVVVWKKQSALPNNVSANKLTRICEFVFVLCRKSEYDTFTMNKEVSSKREDNGQTIYKNVFNFIEAPNNDGQMPNSMHLRREEGLPDEEYYVRNKRDVWNVSVKPCKEAHFATFPPELIRPCILAGCRVGGVVLDPFMGSGTTALVAKGIGRDYIGIELNPEYKAIAERRLFDKFGLFL